MGSALARILCDESNSDNITQAPVAQSQKPRMFGTTSAKFNPQGAESAHCEGWLVIFEPKEEAQDQSSSPTKTNQAVKKIKNPRRRLRLKKKPSGAFASMGESTSGQNQQFLSSGDGADWQGGSDYENDSDSHDADALGQVPETQFEEPQEFVLVNQTEMQAYIGQKVVLSLKYAVLQGCALTLFDDIPPEEGDGNRSDWDMTPTGVPKDEYIVMRKQCLLDTDKDRLQMALQVQECAKKHRPKILIVSVPQAVNKKGAYASSHFMSPHSQVSRVEMNRQMAVGLVGMPVTETYVGQGAYVKWVESIKVAQRPYWAGSEVTSCNICEVEFGFWEGQHHCRKCGMAVCGKCSKYFVQVPELAYYQRVRICLNCLEDMYKTSKVQEMRRNEPSSQNQESLLASFYASGADIPQSVRQGANIFKSQNFASLPNRMYSLNSGQDMDPHIFDSGQTFVRRNNLDEINQAVEPIKDYSNEGSSEANHQRVMPNPNSSSNRDSNANQAQRTSPRNDQLLESPADQQDLQSSASKTFSKNGFLDPQKRAQSRMLLFSNQGTNEANPKRLQYLSQQRQMQLIQSEGGALAAGASYLSRVSGEGSQWDAQSSAQPRIGLNQSMISRGATSVLSQRLGSTMGQQAANQTRPIDMKYDKNKKVRIQPEDTLSSMHLLLPA